MLRQAGVYEREYAQGALQDAWDHYNEVQLLPIRNLDIAGNAVKTVLGTTRSTATTFHKPSALSQVAGLAIAGLSIYTMFSGTSMNPYTKDTAAGMVGPGEQSTLGRAW
jgi:hypothetical protein